MESAKSPSPDSTESAPPPSAKSELASDTAKSSRLLISTVAEVLGKLRDKTLQVGAEARVVISRDGYLFEVKGNTGISCIHSSDPKVFASELNRVRIAESKIVCDIDSQSIYNSYPRRRDIAAARVAIQRAMKDTEIPCAAKDRPLFLALAVGLYSLVCKREGKELTYIPYPATWFNRKSYLNGSKMVLALMANRSSHHEASTKLLAAALLRSVQSETVNGWQMAQSASSASSTNGTSPKP